MNRIWIGMFLIAMIVALSKLIFWQDTVVFKHMVDALFTSVKSGFEIALYLTGALCFWLGIMKIGEQGGAVNQLTRMVAPLFSRLFPEVPREHPAIGAMMMNFSANMLGLDNSATPLGLKAMNELQSINPNKEVASNAQIMFLVLNTSGLTIIPVSIFALRAGSESPASVFLPILICTFLSSLAGLIFVSIRQRINLFDKVVLAYIGGLSLFIGVLLYFIVAHPEYGETISNVVGNLLIFSIIIWFITLGMFQKINVYDAFIEGAKEGFNVAVMIIPYLVGILAAIAVFRASGCLDAIIESIRFTAIYLGVTVTEWIDALPVAFMKPLSGGGARAAYVDIMNTFNIDSMQEKIAATMQGSTETTFYILAVYFGSVNIRNSRYAVTAGLFCDVVGLTAAIFISYLFYVNT